MLSVVSDALVMAVPAAFLAGFALKVLITVSPSAARSNFRSDL